MIEDLTCITIARRWMAFCTGGGLETDIGRAIFVVATDRRPVGNAGDRLGYQRPAGAAVNAGLARFGRTGARPRNGI